MTTEIVSFSQRRAVDCHVHVFGCSRDVRPSSAVMGRFQRVATDEGLRRQILIASPERLYRLAPAGAATIQVC